MKVFIDSWAWIEYFIGSKYGERVASIIENNENEMPIYTGYAAST